MHHSKPILSIEEQVEYLKGKGVRFEIMTSKQAKAYLAENNNYFKLTSYRKNYEKHPAGENEGKYIDLDFAYLVDLAQIDMQLRYIIVHLALDIEHHVKLQLLRKAEEKGEDGYNVVEDYISSLDPKDCGKFKAEINRNRNSIYCGAVIDKYEGELPIWVLIEIVSFGRLINFYRFCAERYQDDEMKDAFYRLLTCKEIRNAAAHNNCILNDLHSKTAQHKTNDAVTKALMSIPDMKKGFRKNRMSNARIQQIVTLLYMHKSIVASDSLKERERNSLRLVIRRCYANKRYYEGNQKIQQTFDFLKLVVDSWF